MDWDCNRFFGLNDFFGGVNIMITCSVAEIIYRRLSDAFDNSLLMVYSFPLRISGGEVLCHTQSGTVKSKLYLIPDHEWQWADKESEMIGASEWSGPNDSFVWGLNLHRKEIRICKTKSKWVYHETDDCEGE